MNNLRIRVIIADDHPVIRLGVKSMLDETPMIQCVGTATSSSELLDLLEQTPCDVLVTDYAMPDAKHGDGLQLLTLLIARHPNLPVVVLTGLDQPALFQAIYAAGIQHILSKGDDLQHVSSAVLAAHARRRYISPSIADLLPTRTNRRAARALSKRESEVLRLYVGGLGINEIAERLDRRKQTISTQKMSAMQKLGIDKDADLFKFASELGLRGPEGNT